MSADNSDLNVKRSELNVERSGEAGGVERSASTAVDADNPWPGLASFTEDLRSFFFGREKETDELVRLVRRNTLTVLFGQSGLGKSSLLQAGVFPLLREADFLPLYLRLDHDPATPPLADQVKAALVEAIKLAGADAPAPRADESLWEYFHRKDIDIWSAKNRLLTPVLGFDQFEEIFTLGRADETRRERGRAFLTELADLVENRPPAALREKFDAGELDTGRYNFDKPSCQVILSLREDFLPDLEGLKREMPALIHNRLRLKKLNGVQALEVVSRPAPQLLAEGVAERIVEFVSGARAGSAERLAELDVEPPLLSVICRELNERRRALGHAQITADLVSGNRREILTDFYERSVADLPEAMRTFVEDHLLTKSGFRDNLALETALDFPGVTRPLLDTLVARRLLRIEDRLGVQRVELTHDVLADVIRGSRDARQQRHAVAETARRTRRLRWVVTGLVIIVLGLSTGAVFGIRAQRIAAERASRTDLEFSAQLMERGNAPAAVARIVRAAQSDPANPVTGTRLISALTRQSWPIWQDTGVRVPAPGRIIAFLPDGQSLLVGAKEEDVLRLLDARTLHPIREFHFPSRLSAWTFARDNSSVFAAALADGSVAIVDVATGKMRFIPNLGMSNWGNIWGERDMALSNDGRRLACATPDKITLIDATNGRILSQINYTEVNNPSSVHFSPDATRVIVTDWGHGFEIRQVPSGEVVLPWTSPDPVGTGAHSAQFSPDGKSFVVSWWNGVALRDAATGARIGHDLRDGYESFFACFDRDGTRVFALGNDRMVRIFDTATQRELLPPLLHGAVVDYAQLSRGGRTLLVRSHDGFVHVWDATTGAPRVEPTMSVPSDLSIALDPDGERVLFAAPDGRILTLGTTPSVVRPLRWMPPGPGVTGARGFTNNSVTRFSIKQPRMLWHLADSGLHDFSLDTGRASGAPSLVPPVGTIAANGDDGSPMLVRTAQNEWSIWRDQGSGLEKSVVLQDTPEEGRAGRLFLGTDLLALFKMEGSLVKSLRLWRLSDGRPAGPEIVLPSPIAVGSITLSPDHARLTLGGSGGLAGIWDIATGRQVANIKTDFPAQSHLMLFSPDGRIVATGTYIGAANGEQHAEARLWDARTGEPRSPVYSHRESIFGLSFSADGRLVLFASGDGNVDVVSTADGRPVCPPLAHPESVVNSLYANQGSGRFYGNDTIVTLTRSMLYAWDARSGLPLMEPMPAEAVADIDPSRSFVAMSQSSGLVGIWPLPPRYENTPVPGWLVRLATSLAGVRLDENGVLLPVAGGYAQTQAELAAIRRELAALPADAPFAAWGRWILADPATRPIGPGFTITAAEADASLQR